MLDSGFLVRRLIASVLCVLALATVVRAAFPTPTGRVTDAAGVFSAGGREQADARITSAEQASGGAEIAVVTVSSLDGMSVEEYANTLFNQWGIGKKGSDNGVLLLVAPTERAVRIEVGYGLEAILPDGLAGDIIRTQALPAFRDGRFEVGILDVLNRIAAIVVAKHVVTPAERAELAADAEERPPSFVTTLFFGVFLTIGGFLLIVGLRAKVGFFVMFGSMFGGIPAVLAAIPFFNVTWPVLGPWILLVMAFAWVKGGSDRWKSIARGEDGRSARKTAGWISGSSSRGGGGSSSRSSSSGSSFGGGRSGGGGASGRW